MKKELSKLSYDISLAWTDHLQDEDSKAKFRNEVLSAMKVLERLETILQERVTNTYTQEEQVQGNLVGNWAINTAQEVGRRRAFKELLGLIPKDRTGN